MTFIFLLDLFFFLDLVITVYSINHVFVLMFGICLFKTLLVGIQSVIATETPLAVDPDTELPGFCSPIADGTKVLDNSPQLLYHLAFVQDLMWVGNTAGNSLQIFEVP